MQALCFLAAIYSFRTHYKVFLNSTGLVRTLLGAWGLVAYFTASIHQLALRTDSSVVLFPRTLLLATLGVRLLKQPAGISSKATYSQRLFQFDLALLPAFFQSILSPHFTGSFAKSHPGMETIFLFSFLRGNFFNQKRKEFSHGTQYISLQQQYYQHFQSNTHPKKSQSSLRSVIPFGWY